MRKGSFVAGLLLGAVLVAVAWAAVGSTPPTDPSPAAGLPAGASGPTSAACLMHPADATTRLDTDTLLIMAEHELYFAHDADNACRLLERALARDLTPDERVRALTYLGTAQRSTGDHAASIATLQRVLEASGVAEERRSHAEFQLMWTYRLQGDLDAALRTGEALVTRGTLRSGLGAATHRALGLFAREVGDLGRSELEFERALEVARHDPALRNFREEIVGWLRAE